MQVLLGHQLIGLLFIGIDPVVNVVHIDGAAIGPHLIAAPVVGPIIHIGAVKVFLIVEFIDGKTGIIEIALLQPDIAENGRIDPGHLAEVQKRF